MNFLTAIDRYQMSAETYTIAAERCAANAKKYNRTKDFVEMERSAEHGMEMLAKGQEMQAKALELVAVMESKSQKLT